MTHLKLLSAGAIQRGVTQTVALYQQRTGNAVEADFMSAPRVRARVEAGESVDVVIASSGAMNELAAAGKIDGAARAVVGRVRMGVVMREGAQLPDLSTGESFRQALLAADAVACNRGSSGAYAIRLIEKLGLGVSGKPKINMLPSGAELMAFIAGTAGRNYGLAQITSMLDAVQQGLNVAFAGALPEEYQNVTTYEAAVATESDNAFVARGLINVMICPEGRRILSEAGLD